MTPVQRTALALLLTTVLGACSSGSSGTNGVGGLTAQAGFDRTVGKREAVQLDGSASFDAGGRPLTYLWTLVSRPAGSAAAIQLPIAPVTQLTTDAVGTYVVRLQVSNGAQVAADELTITAANQAPVAQAGPDASGSKGLPATLSGAGSYDPDQDPLSWEWTLVSAPAGSLAALSDPATSTPTLVPDAFGPYHLRLTVSDGSLAAQDDVVVTVENHAPVAGAGPDLAANAGEALALSAAASSDPDQDPLTCAWTITAWPEGSSAALSDPASCAPSFTPDVEGTYTASLVVSDGQLESAADAVTVTAYRHVWRLGHSVVDAEYSRPLDRLVVVGTGPNRLYLVDPVAETEASVDLPMTPTSVSVAPDGLHAAVGHAGFVSYVRLSPDPLALEKVLATTADVSDVVLAGNGFVYAFPRIDQWETIRCIRIDTEAETLSTGMSIYAGTRAKLHPSGARIYGADRGLSPSDIERYDISGGTAAYAYDSPYHGDYSMCGDLWMSEDGLRIFTACGHTFRASDVTGAGAGADMTYAGSLETTSSVRWVDHATAAGLVLAVPSASDTTIRVFADAYLTLQQTVALPRAGVGGKGFATHGRFAFFSGDASRWFALASIDPTAGLLTPDVVVAY